MSYPNLDLLDSKLELCYRVCERIGYTNKYLRNAQFTNRFIQPLAGSAGKLQTIKVIICVIHAVIMELQIFPQYGNAITQILAETDYVALRELEPVELILVLGTIHYFLGNKFQLAIEVMP